MSEQETNGQEEPKRLKTKRNEVQVILEEEDGSESTYTIRELSGADRDSYLTSAGKKTLKDNSGRPTSFLQDYRGMFSDLLCMSLFDAKGMKVPADRIQKWPHSTQFELFKIAQRLSGFDEKSLEKAKNE